MLFKGPMPGVVYRLGSGFGTLSCILTCTAAESKAQSSLGTVKHHVEALHDGGADHQPVHRRRHSEAEAVQGAVHVGDLLDVELREDGQNQQKGSEDEKRWMWTDGGWCSCLPRHLRQDGYSEGLAGVGGPQVQGQLGEKLPGGLSFHPARQLGSIPEA